MWEGGAGLEQRRMLERVILELRPEQSERSGSNIFMAGSGDHMQRPWGRNESGILGKHLEDPLLPPIE